MEKVHMGRAGILSLSLSLSLSEEFSIMVALICISTISVPGFLFPLRAKRNLSSFQCFSRVFDIVTKI
jgi:hypothetical protein